MEKEIISSLTKSQKSFILSLIGKWSYKGERPGVEAKLKKLEIITNYRNSDCICLTAYGEEIGKSIIENQ